MGSRLQKQKEQSAIIELKSAKLGDVDARGLRSSPLTTLT